MSKLFEKTARDLRGAYGGRPIAPLRGVLEPADAQGAYELQAINTRFWQAQGRRVVGRKAGLTAKAVQQQLGVDQPDFGVLFEDMRIADGAWLDPSRTLQPKVEAEIAFVLGEALVSLETGPEEASRAVASAHAALEIVDSRIKDWAITFADTVADNGSSAFFVISDERVPLDGLDLEGAAMQMWVNGKVASSGTGAAALGNPLNVVAWLASTLAKRGEHLRAGDIVLAGALGPMVALTKGDEVRTRVEGIGECGFIFGDAP